MSDLPPDIQKLFDAAPSSGPHLSMEADRRIREGIKARLEAEARTRPDLRRRMSRRPTALYALAATFAAIVLFVLVRLYGREAPQPRILPEPEPIATINSGIPYSYSAGVTVHVDRRCENGSFWTRGTFVPATPLIPMIGGALPGTLSIVSCPRDQSETFYIAGPNGDYGIVYTGGNRYPSMSALFLPFQPEDAGHRDRITDSFLEPAAVDVLEPGVFDDGAFTYLAPMPIRDSGDGGYYFDLGYSYDRAQRIRPGTTIPTTRFLDDRVAPMGAFYVTGVNPRPPSGSRVYGIAARCDQPREPERVALLGFMSPLAVVPIPPEHPTRGLIEVFRSMGIREPTDVLQSVRRCRSVHGAVSDNVAATYDRLETALRPH